MEQEKKLKLDEPQTWIDFFNKIEILKKETYNFIVEEKSKGKKIAGYGASTKGNVILQFSNINSKLLPLIGEVNPFKFNRYTPGTKIKIVSEEAIKKNKPDYLLVLPWHFKDFIIKKEKRYLLNLE